MAINKPNRTTRTALLRELARGIDPVAFARSLGIEPDDWQKKVLLSPEKRIQILAARQSGKSMICAIYALFHALNHPGAVVLVVSPSLRQSSLLFRTVIDFYRDLGRPLASDVENTRTLELTNKSVIVSLPGVEKTIRGYSGVSLLILDESALIEDDIYHAIRPMLAVSQGKVFAIGTPHGKRGWFWDSWEHSDEYHKVKILASDCPRISKEFLERERRAMGDLWFRQEYCVEFTENDASVFRMDLIEASIHDFPELELDLDDNSVDSAGPGDLTPPVSGD